MNSVFTKVLIFAVFNFLLSFSLLAKNSETSGSKWITLESSNFKIIVNSRYKDQGLHIVDESERALKQLKFIFSETPTNKILVVVDHRTDVSNGSATHFPYPHIVLYPTLPTTYSSIGEYNEWVYELVLHELTHFLTFYPNHGIYRPLKLIFGNLFAPNFVLLPSWFHEGLATSLETHLTLGGRLRSENYKEMHKVMADQLISGKESLATINERYIPTFPFGQRPYFFGSLVVNQSTQDASPENLDALVQGFSKSWPPYNLFSSSKKNLKKRFSNHRRAILRISEQDYDHSAFAFEGFNPLWIGKSSFLTLVPTKNLDFKVMKYDLSKKKPKTILRIRGTNRLVISSDFSLLYDQASAYQRNQTSTDLYIYNIKKKESDRITHGMNLREATFSDNEKLIVAVQTDLVNTQLVSLKASDPENFKVLYAPKGLESRISSPTYLSKDKIVFIEKPRGKESQLKLLDLKYNKVEDIKLPNNFTKIFAIEKHSDQVILHAKEKNKSRQHYILDKKFAARQITFDPVGSRSAALWKDQLLQSRITPKNYRTKLVKKFQDQKNIADSDLEIALSAKLVPSKYVSSKKQEVEPKEYNSLSYMIPRYWFPFITPNYGGFGNQTAISISTGSSDPLGINSYSATLRQDSISERLSGGINYFRTGRTFLYGLFLNQFESPLTENISRTYKSAAASVRYDFGHDRFLGNALTLGINYTDAKIPGLETVPGLEPIKSFGPSLSYEYNALDQEPSRVAPSSGSYTNITASHFIDQEGYFSYNSGDLYSEVYFSKYMPEMTSLKLFTKALASDTKLPTIFTPINLSGYFTNSRQQNSFVIRGYPSGIFQANESAFTLGVEYYFPIWNIFSGPEYLPIFFRRLYGNLVYDFGSFKGRFLAGPSTFADHSYDQYYSGYGIEFHTDLTLGHYIPLKLSLGLYNPIQKIEAASSTQVFLNISTPALP